MSASRARALTLAVAALVASAAGWALLQATAASVETTTVELAPPLRAVDVELAAGDLALRAAGPGGARLDARARALVAPARRLDRAGDRLGVRYGCRLWTSCRVDLDAALPAAADVEARTSFGDVRARGLTGDLRVRTRTGEIAGEELGAGDVRAETTSGAVELGFDRPPRAVTVETTSGDVTVRLPPGPYAIVARSVAGDVTLPGVREGGPGAPRVEVETTSGDVTIVVAP